MKLLPPEVVAPLSVCSTSVQIRGNISGATVQILVNGGETASHVSTRADAIYDIGAPVQANDVVTARQELNGDVSEVSLPVTVQDVPQQLSALTLQTVLHECGRRVRMSGGVPGAEVEGSINNQPVGAGVLISGRTSFMYDPVLAAGQPLTLVQATCNNLSASQASPPALPQPSPLLAPLIQEPLIECQNTITIGGVTDGAFVELYRNGGLEDTFAFSTSKEWRWIKPLEKEDLIDVRQGFKCKIDSPELESFSPKASATVQSVDALPAPNILGKPCPGTPYVTMSNLIPGTRVVLLLDDQELGQTDAPASTYTFPTPLLPAGAVLTAFMVLCDKEGPADTVTVSNQALSLQELKVSDLFACAAFVYVKVVSGTSGNNLVYITNKNGQQISAYHNLLGFHLLIPVSPSLIAGDEITVNALSCGGAWQTVGPFAVSAGAPPPPEFVEPVVSGTNEARVRSLHAGAVIDVYVNAQWKGSAISVGNLDVTLVYLGEELETGDQVFGTQTLCGRTSRPSQTITVKKPKPEQPILLKPDDEATNVSVQPLFQWEDPGAGLENEAESFQLTVKQGNNTVIDTTVPDPQHQSSTVLQHNTSYEWTVIAKNSTGNKSANVDFTFQTEAPPEPEEADLQFVPPIYSNAPLGSFPKNTEFAIFIDVTNEGNIASPDYEVYFELLSTDEDELLYVSQMVPQGPLAAGATEPAGVAIIITDPDPVRINAFLLVNNQEIESAFRIVQ